MNDDLISRKRLKNRIALAYYHNNGLTLGEVKDIIDNAPTVEINPSAILNDYKDYWHCDNCGLITKKSTSEIYNEPPRYCLRCGCRFDEISKEGEERRCEE